MFGAKGAVSGLPQGMPRVDASQTLTGSASVLSGRSASAPVAKALAAPVPASPVTVNATPPPHASAAAPEAPAGSNGGDSQPQRDSQLQVEGRVAAERLQQAKMRIQMLQFRARSAAASGDSQEADRAAREAATVAREISQLAQQLTRSQGGDGDEAASSGRVEDVVRRRREAGPDTRSIAQGLLADAAPRGQVTVDTTDGFLVEARALASQARTLVDLATTLHDQAPGKEPMFAPQAATMTESGEAFVAATEKKVAEVPEAGAWADIAAAEDALEEASPVPAQPKRFAPEPGTLVKLSV